MEPTTSAPALYLIQIEMGGTAGPFDLGQLREMLELDRASPDDRLVHVSTRQGLKMTELIPDAAEIHRRRKSDRLRRRSDRLTAQPEIPKGEAAPVVPAQPVNPAAPIDLNPAAPTTGTKDPRRQLLVGVAAVATILVVLGSFAWDFCAEYFHRISPREFLGSWRVEMAQDDSMSPGLMLPPALVADLREQLKDLTITFTTDTVTLVGKKGRLTNGWKIEAAAGEFMQINFTKPCPPLDEVTTIVRVGDRLGLVTPIGLATLKKLP